MRSRSPLRPTPVPRDLTEASRFKLVHPSSDSNIARARSDSSRSDEPARPRNSTRCSAVAAIHDRPDMFPPHAVALHPRFSHMWMVFENPA